MPHKELRKIVRIGNVSLGVILPKSWVDYYNLKYGDKVKVISNGSVKISPQNLENKENE